MLTGRPPSSTSSSPTARPPYSVMLSSCASANVPGELATTGAARSRSVLSPGAALRALIAAPGNRACRGRSGLGGQAALEPRGARRQVAQLDSRDRRRQDGRLHPNKLLAAIQDRLDASAIVINDGGDFLVFGRIGLARLDHARSGTLRLHWCGRAQWHCRKPGVSAQKGAGTTSDGAFGFNAIEIDTAVRHKAPVVIVVANNGAWQIEVHDQTVTHGKVVGTKLQSLRPRRHGPRLWHVRRAG